MIWVRTGPAALSAGSRGVEQLGFTGSGGRRIRGAQSGDVVVSGRRETAAVLGQQAEVLVNRLRTNQVTLSVLVSSRSASTAEPSGEPVARVAAGDG